MSQVQSIEQALKSATAKLAEGGKESPSLDAAVLLCHVLGKPRTYLLTWPEKALEAEQKSQFDALLERRLTGEPVAYILGYQHFWSLKLFVGRSTLIPRADTELLVEKALGYLADGDYRVADLGTGTGAVALSLATERFSWQVDACDYQLDAVMLAKKNAKHLKLDNVSVHCGSWFEPLKGKYHMIVSNPPYIDPEDPATGIPFEECKRWHSTRADHPCLPGYGHFWEAKAQSPPTLRRSNQIQPYSPPFIDREPGT